MFTTRLPEATVTALFTLIKTFLAFLQKFNPRSLNLRNFKNKLQNYYLAFSYKRLKLQLLSLSLIISLLSTSTFAAPQTGTFVVTSLSEFGQDIRYSWLAGNLGASLFT